MKRLTPAMLILFVLGCNGNAILSVGGAPNGPGDTPGPTAPSDPTSPAPPGPSGPAQPPPPPPPMPTCDPGRSYTAFGLAWSSSRVDAKAGADRRRLKPFSALGDEFTRAIMS